MLGIFHVDKIDYDQAAQIAKPHLARHFFGGFHIGLEGGIFDVCPAGGAGGVYVNGNKSFCMVNHNGTAAWEPAQIVGHYIAHEFGYLFVNFGVVHQNFADIGAEIVADGADDQRAFHKQEIGLGMGGGGIFNCLPELLQIIEIPSEFFGGAADAGGACNQAHAWRNIKLRHGFFEFGAFFAFNPAGYAAAARIVRHQNQIAAGEADEGGQCCAFVAALVFFHLYDNLHAFFEHVLDAGFAAFVFLEIGTGNFFEGEKAVAVGAVVHKTGFK